MKYKKHANIPVFIPHLGCPNNCVFCNQRSISGHMSFEPSGVKREIETALATIGEGTETEIAYFGGSFTGIDRDLMIYLLEVADSYVKEGKVTSIRLSTRPDYIDDEILDILKKHDVKTVELGLQSMVPRVLEATKRGHTAECAEKACRLIKAYGFEFIGQMMIGLPLSSGEDEVYTAREICEMGADGARIYPTVVFYETELCDMAKRGLYMPLTNEDAVIRTKDVLKVFAERNIPCIRVGLCASENLSSPDTVYSGANHSAIGELAMGELFFDRMDAALFELLTSGDKSAEGAENGRDVIFYVPKGAVSKVVGQKKKNILRLKEKYFVKYGLKSIRILENDELMGYNIKIEICGTGGKHSCT